MGKPQPHIPVEPMENGYIRYGRAAGKRKIIFTARDQSGQEVKKMATIDAHCRKIILIQPSETLLYDSGLSERGVPGYLYIFAHATAVSIQGVREVDKLVTLISASLIWRGEPVLIDACNAGAEAGGIASKLAAALATYVTAPTKQTWNYPLGGPAVGQGAFEKLPGLLSGLPIPNFFRPGTWRTWGPDGTLTGETRTSPRDTGIAVPSAAAREFDTTYHRR